MPGKRHTPCQRLIVAAGITAGLSEQKLNDLLASVGLPNVNATSFDIVRKNYAPRFRATPELLAEHIYSPMTEWGLEERKPPEVSYRSNYPWQKLMQATDSLVGAPGSPLQRLKNAQTSWSPLMDDSWPPGSDELRARFKTLKERASECTTDIEACELACETFEIFKGLYAFA